MFLATIADSKNSCFVGKKGRITTKTHPDSAVVGISQAVPLVNCASFASAKKVGFDENGENDEFAF